MQVQEDPCKKKMDAGKEQEAWMVTSSRPSRRAGVNVSVLGSEEVQTRALPAWPRVGLSSSLASVAFSEKGRHKPCYCTL